jgi:hypothetical protein
MNEMNIVQEIASLPPEAQQQVADFVAFLKSKYPTPSAMVHSRLPLAEEPFVGMWHGREEMQDSTEWVRALRQSEWERPK